MQQTKQTRSMFLTRALERILADKELKKSYNAQLKRSCQLALEEIKKDGLHQSPGDGPPKTAYTFAEAERYFMIFETACKSKSPSIVSISLDCLQKMIVYGMLVGSTADAVMSQKPLLDRMVEAICQCFNGVHTDERVQLQIIKVLLTAVTSNNCEIHEGVLLLAIRTCYNVHLASKNAVNQTTAKATLTQMLNVIFSRMEAQAEYDQSIAKKLEEERKEMESPDARSNHINNEQQTSDQVHMELTNSNGKVESHGTAEDKLQEVSVANKLNGVADNQSEDSDSPLPTEQVVESVLRNIIKKVVSNVTISDQDNGLPSPAALDDSSSQMHDESNQHSRRTSTSSAASEALRMGGEVLEKNIKFSHALQKDAFLVFRSFCKLSMKLLSNGPPDPKSPELRSKVLSLDLLWTILESAGPVFKSNEMFIDAIKQYLCVALSKNGVSPVVEVFRVSLEIFIQLLQNFKTHLKIQIQVFFKEIFLNILESSSSSFQHKMIVLEMALRICSDAQLLVDIYVNYDCDINAVNIFHDLMTLIGKIAQTSNHSHGFSPVQDQELRKLSLECVVSTVKCMQEWSKELYVNPQHLSHLGKEHMLESHPGDLSTGSSAGSHFSVHSDSSDHHNTSLEQADNPEALEVVKQQKDILEQGIDMFNKKPHKGISFLQAQSMTGRLPSDIAEFLLNESRLNPAQIGDYLGENEKLNKEVMYAYIDLFDFTGIDFVSALRLFLESFRLPGEAQKIDRLMEKFASRYCDCNPHGTVFASADAAYVLAYSIIMLTTDLHSAQIKKKITRNDYIRMNRGINDSKDLPPEYLEDIYNQIKRKEIALKPRRSTKVASAKGSAPSVHRLREMDEMATTAKALMEAASHVQAEFIRTTHHEHVRPMFKACWRYVLVALSMGLQDFEDSKVTTLCLNGMKYAVRVACIFGLALERDTFIQALSRFSLLQATAGMRELKWKNIESIKTLISIAYTDGNYLQESWHEILKCISHLELLQLIGSGVKDQTTSAMRKSVVLDNNPILTKTFGMEQRKLATIQESMGETSSQSIVVAVDRIFTGSTRLDGDAIVDFVQWLCKVSLVELCNPSHPRKFSLQKLVEISYYNMGRVRIQWSRIWAILGEHFNAVGCRDDESVAFFAVDSLRQLSMKFLEKGELSGFSFQKDFLRPFEHIMKHNPSPMIQDMVVRCIAQMVTTQAHNIKSGWKNIFTVFAIAASHKDESIVELSFITTSNIITDTFQFYFSSIIHCFQDAISALREFSCCSFPDTSMEAIRLIRQCADYVAMKPEAFEDLMGEDPQTTTNHGNRVWIRGWFPVLFELSCIVSRCTLDVRTRGLTVMFEIMKTHGHSFRINWWKDLFQIIFRIFDQMKVTDQVEKSDWFATTCNHALFAVCDVFTQYYDVLAPALLADIYEQLHWCIETDNEQLARSAVNCFENLILSNGEKLSDDKWQLSCEAVQKIFKTVSPHLLLTWSPEDPNSNNDELHRLHLYCVLTSEMIESIDRILFFPNATKADDEHNTQVAKEPIDVGDELRHPDELFPRLSTEQLLVMVRCLHESHDFAKRFNCNHRQRDTLWKAGFKGKAKPVLIRQETRALLTALRILFRLLKREDSVGKVLLVLQRTCRIALSYHNSIKDAPHRAAWYPILLVILTRILRCQHEVFANLSGELHSSFCDLLLYNTLPEVRLLLRKYFIRHNAVALSR